MSESHDAKQMAWETLKSIIAQHRLKPHSIWRHYKGGLYTIISISIDEETLFGRVSYFSNLFESETTRSLVNFLQEVEVEDSGGEVRRVQRFVRVEG